MGEVVPRGSLGDWPFPPGTCTFGTRQPSLLTSRSASRDHDSPGLSEILDSLVSLLGLDDRSRTTLARTLRRRENLGSTGIGKGIAIPHCRSLVVNRLHLAYGRHPGGVHFESIDGKPVSHFFLIVAPPLEVSGQYLPTLGRIAQFARDPDVPAKLAAMGTSEELFRLLEAKGM